jgi:hypothetical protein
LINAREKPPNKPWDGREASYLAMAENKGNSRKRMDDKIWSNSDWVVARGRLVRGKGRPPKTSHLFEFVAEKIPFESIQAVKKRMLEMITERPNGVYLAHDSMGVARYGGRGDIFTRLVSHRKKYSKELRYFSFYVIANKAHEREIETVILRAAGPQMTLNTRKIAAGLHPGNISDYEPGTNFFERQRPRGRKHVKRKPKNLR